MADLGVNVEEGRRATAPLENGAVVLLCSDVVERRKSPLAPEEVGAALRRHCPGARVVVVPSLCSWSSDLLAILQSLGARRVVVGCSQGNAKRQKILGVVRSCGVHPAGAQVVDLAPGPGTGPKRLTEQSMARLRSALAGVSCADLGAPVHESTVPFSSVRVSRRGLFSFGYIVSRPVAGWSSELCAGHGPARPCTLACPHGALSVTGGRISVDQAVCTGCGACASACRSGAMSLTGTSIAALEASASALVEDARRLGLGVAIVCSKASATLELGGDWLELQVPSLNMVSVGWALQVVATGVGVTLVGCNDPGCGERARQVMSLSAIVVSEVAPRQRHLVVAWGCRLPAPPSAEGADAPSFDDGFRPSIALREPEATVRALSDLACRINELGGGPVLASPGPTGVAGPAGREPVAGCLQRPWRFESALAPLGEIAIDSATCSGCGCCLPPCPSGALSAAGPAGTPLALSFDARACSACGACVLACPEGALSLRRVIASSTLSADQPVITDIGGQDRCISCGKPLAGDLVTRVVARRLAASHPQIAGRLENEDRCADCLLVGHGTAARGRRA